MYLTNLVNSKNCCAKGGAKIFTWIYVVDDRKDQSLLGEKDATRLEIVKLDVDGAAEEVVQQLSVTSNKPNSHIVSGWQSQQKVGVNMADIIQEFSSVFPHSTGKFVGDPIKIHMKSNAAPVVQPPRRIHLHYIPKLKTELNMILNKG